VLNVVRTAMVATQRKDAVSRILIAVPLYTMFYRPNHPDENFRIYAPNCQRLIASNG
jgi:hypothetical protein